MKNFSNCFPLDLKHKNLLKAPSKTKLAEHVRLATITGGAQIVVQLVNLATGILIIRWMSHTEYAYYTLANTMMGTMTVLADGGIGSGVMAGGGRIWTSRDKLGEVVVTGMNLRRVFAFASLIVTVPALAYLLHHQGASWPYILIIVAALVVGFWAALSDSLLEIPSKLHQDIRPLQKNQLWVGLLRFAFVLFVILMPFTWVALLANGLPRIYGNIKLKQIASKFADFTRHESAAAKKDILKIVRRVLPASIYYCFSGQIAVWLISIFGNNLSVAQIGALGRLAMVLSFFTTVFNTLIMPRFARAESLRLKKNFLIILALLAVTGVLLLGGSVIFASLFLKVLGQGYAGLETELVLCMLAGYMNVVANLLYHLGLGRGWIISPVVSIGANLIFMAVGIWMFNMSVLREVIYFQLFMAATAALLNVGYCLYKLYGKDKTAGAYTTASPD